MRYDGTPRYQPSRPRTQLKLSAGGAMHGGPSGHALEGHQIVSSDVGAYLGGSKLLPAVLQSPLMPVHRRTARSPRRRVQRVFG